MLRAVFVLNALLFLPAGLLLYFAPPALSQALGVAPLWLLRVAAALLIAWGAQLATGAVRPSTQGVAGLAAGNLLIAATLIPAALRGGLSVPLADTLIVLGVLLLALAVLALILPGDRSRA